MSATGDCSCRCPTPDVTEVPGTDGQDAFTLTTASFDVPALGDTVVVNVANSDWMNIGNGYFIPNAGFFTLHAINSQQQVVLTYLDIAQNTATGNTIATGAKVAAGSVGENGTDGVNSYTVTTADFECPAIGGNVDISVANNSWMVVGNRYYIQDAGVFRLNSKGGTTSINATYANVVGNTEEGETIPSGSGIGASGFPANLSAALPNAITDNTTGTASDTLAAGVGISIIAIPITLVAITGAGDVLTTYTPGYAFKLLSFDARVVEPVTTGGDGASLNLEIGTTNVTGGVIALTSANSTPLGAAIAGTAITADNVGTDTDTISIEASSVTPFAEGAVVVLIRIQNMDTANAVASLADHVNDLITSLTP